MWRGSFGPTVAGDSRERAIELAKHMEDSGRFAETNITGERSTQSTTGDTEQMDIVAIYIPEPLVASPAAPKAKTESESKSKPNPTSGTPKGSKR